VLKNTRSRREEKRANAEARQKKYDSLSVNEKLARAKKGGRQYNKLMAHLEGSK
jgi:hypothetical protein